MGSPEIRHVPIERILSEAVYAPIKNKENKKIASNNGRENSPAILLHFGFSVMCKHTQYTHTHASKAIADQN